MIFFLLFVAAWVLCGAGTLAISVWLDPDRFDPETRVKSHHPYEYIWLDGAKSDVAGLTFLVVTMWPFAIIFVLVNGLRKALLRSKREKLKVRTEMEKELSAARKEVEDLLRSARK